MNQDAEDLDDVVKKLIGKTISHVWVDMNDGELEFRLSTNNVLHIWHQHQCCECVYLADIAGVDSVNQLEGETVLDAYVSYSDGGPVEDEDHNDSQWTFLVLRTNNYTVTFRWYGSSNGYYSMCPDTFIWKE